MDKSITGTLLNNYAHIFELLSRLRQAVDHPWVTNGIQITHASEVRSDVCGICGMDIPTLSECSISACRHTFHKTCILEHIELIETGNQLDKDEIAVQQALDKDGTTKESESPVEPKINANQPGDINAPGDESTEDTAESARNSSHNDKPPVGGDDANPTATNRTTISDKELLLMMNNMLPLPK